MDPCKHSNVRVVSRYGNSEYVECVDCGEVFEFREFKDMQNEERARGAAA